METSRNTVRDEAEAQRKKDIVNSGSIDKEGADATKFNSERLIKMWYPDWLTDSSIVRPGEHFLVINQRHTVASLHIYEFGGMLSVAVVTILKIQLANDLLWFHQYIVHAQLGAGALLLA